MKAWHFVGTTLRDGSPVPDDGVTLRHNGDLELCASGLHASQQIIDALRYAPGNTICRVECDGEIVAGHDKLVCSERTIRWRVDGEELLRTFARQCALDVIHLWDAPDVVREYLETGDKLLRAAAWYAASEAAWYAAMAASEAARDAAMAARDAAAATASAAACSAASEAACSAASEAAWYAEWDAAKEKQNTLLEQMVREAR